MPRVSEDASSARSARTPQASAAADELSAHSSRAWRRTANNAPLAGDTSRVPDRTAQVEQADEQVKRPSAASRAQDRQAQKNKSRADKLFDKQYGKSDASAPEAGPRAAVYKGKMGKSHKKAIESLGDATSGVVSGVQGMAASLLPEPASDDAPRRSKSSGTPISAVAIGVILVVLFVVVFLYPSAQQYYIELRTHQKLEAEYDAVMAHNDAIQEKIDALATDEGIEDEAHSQLGWVKEGETYVTVEGLDDGSESSSSSSSSGGSDSESQEGAETDGEGELSPNSTRKSVVEVMPTSDDIPAPTTWYSPFLDWLFGYDPDPGATKAAQRAAEEAAQAEAEAEAVEEPQEPADNPLAGIIKGDDPEPESTSESESSESSEE